MWRRLFVLICTLAMAAGGAGDAALDRATLRGIKAVHVVMDPVAPEIENEGVTAEALRTRLEDLLSRGGIAIDPASAEFVALRFTSVRAARGPFALAATIGLYQPVTLVRDGNIRTATQTWEVETVMLADAKQVNRACLESVDELAGRFESAYRSANAPSRAANK